MDQLLRWECRCTLLNKYGESRCGACGAPKSRQHQQKQQQQEPQQQEQQQQEQQPQLKLQSGHASPPRASSPSKDETVRYLEAEASTRGEYSAQKRGRPSLVQRSRQNKRCRSSSHRDILESALAKPAEAAPAVTLDSSVVDSIVDHRSNNGSEVKRIGNTRDGGWGAGYGSCESNLSSKSVLATAVTTVFSDGATPQLKSQRSPPFSSSPTAATATTTTIATSAEINGSKEEENTAQTSLSNTHHTKRKAIGATLARSAFAKLRGMTWDDVHVDWSPEENFILAERRLCSLLGIDTLGVPKTENGRTRRGTSDGLRVAAAEAVSGGTGAEADSGEELLMSSLFPLPRPKPVRYVKNGIYAKSGAAAPTAARPEAAAATVTSSPPPLLIQDKGPVSEGYVSPVPIRPPQSAAGHDGSKPVDALPEVEGAEGIKDPDADGRSASASTIATVDNNLTQYNMDATERSRAYKNIFRGGVEKEKPKKRPRSPVVKTPLRLPFPMAPRGGVGSYAIFPCGNGAHAQMKSDSEWQGGLLHGLKSSNVDGIKSGGDGTADDEVKADAEGKHAMDLSFADALCPRDFRLPYEVMYDYQVEMFNDEVRQLGVRSTADALREFKNTTSNVYLSKKPTAKDTDEVHRCNCKPSPDGQPGCREACSNRATNEECTPRTCGLRGNTPCDNRKIQSYKQEYMRRKVCIKDVGAKGIGLVAKMSIPAGSLIGEYVGEVMSEDSWQERQVTLGGKQKHKYVMDLGDGEVIDASQCGSILRFVNHSCGPNAEVQKWTIQDKQRIGLFAKDYIERGEEVTFNYCYVRYDEEARECLCGHPNCVRTLGTKRGEVDEKSGGVSWAKGGGGGVGSCSRAGGSGQGNKSNGRGRRGRSSPKLEDPETGETVRPWLHPEDAENIEKYIIRTINNGGRVNTRDLGVVKTKRLFLKRSIPLACRRLVAEHAKLVEAALEVGPTSRAKSSTIMEADRRMKAEEVGALTRRLNRLQASIIRERALCERREEASQTTACNDITSETEPQSSSEPCIVSAAAAGASRTPFFEPSTSRTRLFVREMQEEVLRVGREALRARKYTTPGSSASSVTAADIVKNGAVGAGTSYASVSSASAADITVNGTVGVGLAANGSPAGSSSAAAGNGVEAVSNRGRGRPRKFMPKATKVSKPKMGTGAEGSPERKTAETPTVTAAVRITATAGSASKEKLEGVDSVGSNEKEIAPGEESGTSRVDGGDQSSAAANRKEAEKESRTVSAENPPECGSFEGLHNGEQFQELSPEKLSASSHRSRIDEGEGKADGDKVSDTNRIPSDAKLHPASEPKIGSSRWSSPSCNSLRKTERSRERGGSRAASRYADGGKRGSVRSRDERGRRKPFPPPRRDPSSSSSRKSSQSRSSSGSVYSGSRKRRQRFAASWGSSGEDSRGGSRSSREVSLSKSRGSSRRSGSRSYSRRSVDQSTSRVGKANIDHSACSSGSSGRGGREREGSSHRRSRECESPSPRRRKRDSRSPRCRERDSRSPRCRERDSHSAKRRERDSHSAKRRKLDSRSPRRKERDSRGSRRQERVSSSRERSQSEGVAEERGSSLRSSKVRNRCGRRRRGRRRLSGDLGERDHSESQSLVRRSRQGSRPRDRRSRRDLPLDSRSPPSGPRGPGSRGSRSPDRRSCDRKDDPAKSSNVESDSSVASKRSRTLKRDGGYGVETHNGECRGSGSVGLRREGEFSSYRTMAPSHVVGKSQAGETKTLSVDDEVGDTDSSDESEDSVTFAPALRVMKAKYGNNFYRDLGVEANERLKEEQEIIRVRERQRKGTMPPTEDPTKAVREMVGVMIPKASRKLPRDVHRKILEMFQVIILEPYYYPSRSETPPAYVIGPVAHVLHAHKLLAGIHAQKQDATITAVLDASMLGALDVRRADTGGNVLKRPKSYDITPEQADALLDKRRLAWLLGESCRLTGAMKAHVSRKRWPRNDGPPVCKVTVEGTLRQCREAWGILKVGIARYPYVEAFERRHPPPESPRGSLSGDIASSGVNGHSAASGTAAVAANLQAPAQPASRVGLQFGQGLGVGFRLTKPEAAGVYSESGLMRDWDDGWGLPANLVEQPRLVQGGPGHVSSSAGSFHSTLDSGGSAVGRKEASRAEAASSSDVALEATVTERPSRTSGGYSDLLAAVEEERNSLANPSPNSRTMSQLAEEVASTNSSIVMEVAAKSTTRLAVASENVSVSKDISLGFPPSASNHQARRDDGRGNGNEGTAHDPGDLEPDTESRNRASHMRTPSPDVFRGLQKRSSHERGSSCEMHCRGERKMSEKSLAEKHSDKARIDRPSSEKSHAEKHSDKARVDWPRSEKSHAKKHSDKAGVDRPRSEKSHAEKHSDKASVDRPSSEKFHAGKHSDKARVDRPRSEKSHAEKHSDKAGVDRPRSEKSHAEKHSDKAMVDRPSSEKSHVENHSDKARVDRPRSEKSHAEKHSDKAGVDQPRTEESHAEKHSDMARVDQPSSKKSHAEKHSDKARIDRPSSEKSQGEKHLDKAGVDRPSSKKSHAEKQSDKTKADQPRSEKSHVKKHSDKAGVDRSRSEKSHVENHSDKAEVDRPSSEKSHVKKHLDKAKDDRPSDIPRRSRDRARGRERDARWPRDKRSVSRNYSNNSCRRSNSRLRSRNRGDSLYRKRSLTRTRSPERRRGRVRQQCSRRSTCSRSRNRSRRPSRSPSRRRRRSPSRRRSRRPSRSRSSRSPSRSRSRSCSRSHSRYRERNREQSRLSRGYLGQRSRSRSRDREGRRRRNDSGRARRNIPRRYDGDSSPSNHRRDVEKKWDRRRKQRRKKLGKREFASRTGGRDRSSSSSTRSDSSESGEWSRDEDWDRVSEESDRSFSSRASSPSPRRDGGRGSRDERKKRHG